MNFLIVTLSNIGDVILTTPVISSLRAAHPDSRLTVVCGPKAEPMLRGSRMIDELVIYDKRGNWQHQLNLILTLRRRSYDAVIDLRNTAIPFLVSARRRSPLFRKFSNTNMRDRHLEILKQTGYPASSQKFDFFSEAEKVSAQAKLTQSGLQEGGFIAVAPIAASGVKTWPLEKFKSVIQELLRNFSGKILLLGDPREASQMSGLAELSPRISSLAGQTNLRESAAVLSQARLLLSNDSALMHLGFELGIPVAAIFGPTNHLKYGHQGERFRIVRNGVFCSPCEKALCRFERQSCFEDLTPDQVTASCRELLHAD